MYRLCQCTWRKNHSQAELKTMFEGMALQDFTILNDNDSGKPLVTVQVSSKINGLNKRLAVNVICEESAYKARLSGTWGVNPISVMKIT